MRLSTTLACWKKSCHGSTVVPTTATISSSRVAFRPPGMLGTTPAKVVAALAGEKKASSGNVTRVAITRKIRNRSQYRYVPPAITANSNIAERTTDQKLDSPKNESACSTPMNSTTMVTALIMNRSATEKVPQNFPNLA